MNLDLKQLPAKILPIIERLKKYQIIAFILLLSFVFGFLIIKINGYAQIEPTDEAVTEKLTAVQRPRIDENALVKIQQLEDQNIEVQSLFEKARDNPFSE